MLVVGGYYSPDIARSVLESSVDALASAAAAVARTPPPPPPPSWVTREAELSTRALRPPPPSGCPALSLTPS